MTIDDLREEINIELENIGKILEELAALQLEVKERNPTIREKTAAAAFLAQFYNGIENILKRISRFYAVPLPHGDMRHVARFKRFCQPFYQSLPGRQFWFIFLFLPFLTLSKMGLAEGILSHQQVKMSKE